jgi:hypothetical protein
MFSRLKVLVGENSVEQSNTIKDQLVNLKSKFSKYFPEVVNDKYKWIPDPFHVDSPKNYKFSLSLEENSIDIVSDTFLRVQFPKKSYVEFV